MKPKKCKVCGKGIYNHINNSCGKVEIEMIYCCGCNKKVNARLTNGAEIYPHRKDLHKLPFWKCDSCGNYVGCHHKSKNKTAPLGYISTPELRNARMHIHRILDQIWNGNKEKRKQLYQKISDKLGWNFHVSKIRRISEARQVYKIVRMLKHNI